MSRFVFPESERFQLPQPPAPQPTPAGFVLCNVPVFPGQSIEQLQWIYQQAFEKAQAAVRPSILERDLLGFWN